MEPLLFFAIVLVHQMAHSSLERTRHQQHHHQQEQPAEGAGAVSVFLVFKTQQQQHQQTSEPAVHPFHSDWPQCSIKTVYSQRTAKKIKKTRDEDMSESITKQKSTFFFFYILAAFFTAVNTTETD
ncbi:hypothetical protein BC939DRAFT_446945, partial [Gamsiella multidivaricata]|uniref:uncharacterized protein n=1 Tax=Gamsiella multidivaricata TaxID=101098 RepID=UPI00221EF87E